MSFDEKIQLILAALAERGSVLVAFSGGVDSSVLAALAFRALGKKAIAVTADSQTLAPDELDCAKTVAKEIGISHAIICYDELGEPGFAENPVDRCYHCKKGLIRELKKSQKSRIYYYRRNKYFRFEEPQTRSQGCH